MRPPRPRPARLRSSLAAALTLLLTLGLAATASAAVTHTVRRGETLTSIAATDGLSVAQLAAANGLSTTSELLRGQPIVIPPRGGRATATAAAPTAATANPVATTSTAGSGNYRVARGDTLSGIAARFGTSTAALAAANGLSVSGLLLAGSWIHVPGATTAASATTATATATATAGGAQPTDEFLAASTVGEIAAADGVPAAFAEAVADQESGFDNAEVSRTGAVGVMQIEPGSWRDLESAGLALSPDSALDNARGGVVILRSLLAATGGREAEAAAAYYQGLSSVRRDGMYPSTRRYVADVLALTARFGG